MAAAKGLFASDDQDAGIEATKAAPVERVFRPSKEQRASFEILPVATRSSGRRARRRAASPSTTTTTCPWSPPIPAASPR